MATLTRQFGTASQIIGVADGYILLSGLVEQFSSVVDLTTSLGAHLVVEVDFDGSPSYAVDINIYGSIDGVNFDDTPVSVLRIDFAIADPNQVTFIIEDLAYFKVGAKHAGSESGGHSVRAYIKPWTYVVS